MAIYGTWTTGRRSLPAMVSAIRMLLLKVLPEPGWTFSSQFFSYCLTMVQSAAISSHFLAADYLMERYAPKPQ
jgi:hypothetical protein